MIKSLKEYIDKILKASNEKEEVKNPSKMKRVNIFDKLKFKKLNNRLKPRVNSNDSVNNSSGETPKLNIEKVKEAVLIISAVVLIGVRIC